MIIVKHTPNSISVVGHANHAPRGQDIVCAAVSTLTQVFVESVDKLTDDIIQSDMRAGNALIQYGKNLSDRGQILRDSFFLGLEMLEQAYPQHIHILTEP